MFLHLYRGIAVILALFTSCHAQIHQPVKWQFDALPADNGKISLIFKAAIEKGWHLYSQHIEEGGPVPTRFTFEPSEAYEILGPVKESKSFDSFDSTFQMRVQWFEGSATFSRLISVKAPTVVKGTVEFMVCNNQMCQPPETIRFSIAVRPKENASHNSIIDKEQGQAESDTATVNYVASVNDIESPVATTDESSSLWGIFIAGFLGGLAAFIMPCIFPMVPFTVGLFSKRSRTKKSAVILSMVFGFSVIVIYTALGLVITTLFGSDALNNIATNGVFNFLFFLLLVVFAASFLGAFEITLPSEWVNRIDTRADRMDRFSIFFAAASLALVSFSCTGPIIGTLLVEAASTGTFLSPAVGMIGFSAALALPFMLFAIFPAWLKALPKSGGWLNSVKVTLGFLELALALKFLSNVDLAYHWQWFDREVFLVLWIIIFGLLGFYLLGKIKLPHDSEVTHLSVGRLFSAIVILAFTLYLVPGLWGAPLKVVSAFLPPQHTQDFDLYTVGLGEASASLQKGERGGEPKKYADIFHAPLGLNTFFDYEEGLAYARQVKKPVMIDFTGHACVNCRKMETTVWPEKEVLNTLREDYVLIQLYVDDKTELPDEEQMISEYSGKKIATIGNKWSDFQASVFNTNSQPYYVLLSDQGKMLTAPQGANYDALEFKKFLDKGIETFNASAR